MTALCSRHERANDIARMLAGRAPAAWLLLLSVLIVGLVGDLWSKRLAFEHLWHEPVVLEREVVLGDPDWHPPPARTEVVPKVLDFRLVINRGAVFGIGPGQRWFFVSFTAVAVSIGVLIFALRTRADDRLAHVAIGCILAGALGNLYDRIVYGAVRDFLNMLPEVRLPFGLTWWGGNPEVFPWVFNIADVLLLLGIGLLMIRLNRQPQTGPDHG